MLQPQVAVYPFQCFVADGERLAWLRTKRDPLASAAFPFVDRMFFPLMAFTVPDLRLQLAASHFVLL